jgi:membrane protein YqaA with SNARE-associated domain
LLLARKLPLAAIVAVASVEQIWGSSVNWFLGRSLLRFQDKHWFPVSRRNMVRTENWYRRYGKASPLLSWVLVVGGPLTVVVRVLREPLWSLTMLMGIAKVGRYLVLTALTLGVLPHVME